MWREWCLYFLRAPATTAVVSLARFGGCLCLCWGAGAFTAQYLLLGILLPAQPVRFGGAIQLNKLRHAADYWQHFWHFCITALKNICSCIALPLVGYQPSGPICSRTCVTGVRIWVQSCVRGAPFFLQRSSLLSTLHWHTGNQHSLSETRVCMYLMVNQTLGL